VPEIVARAFVEAQTPTPGPVVVVLPEDMLEDRSDAPVIEPLRVPQAGPASAADIDAIAALIAKAERPLLLAGGIGLGSARGRRALLAASEAHQLPVALTFKRQDYFPNTHPNYAGHLGFKIPKAAVARYLEADLILAVGTRLTEATTQGYTLPSSPVPRQPLVHVHDDPRQIGRDYTTARALVADPVAVLEALAGRPGKAPPKRGQWLKTLNDPVAKAMAWAPPTATRQGAVVATLVAGALTPSSSPTPAIFGLAQALPFSASIC
jgi:acetolactate synthase-1/2/3 large subunit